jgi:hypothetical protein
MALSVGIHVHEQVVLLGASQTILEHFLNITTLEVAVNKKSVGLHHMLLLLFEVSSILLVALDMFEGIRVESFGG